MAVTSELASLQTLIEEEGFVWLTGIEDTFVAAPHPATGRGLDEYDLTGHYAAWASDLELVKDLGVRAARYGLPWHRLNPEKGRWDFTWSDAVIERLLEHGIAPVLDLVHYGVPEWMEGAFAHPDYDAYVEEYAAKLLERYGDRVTAFTPLNEPRITAWYAGKLGLWPPYRRGWRGFFAILLATCRGIVRVTRLLQQDAPGSSVVHVDAADRYVAEANECRAEAERLQLVGFLALDLISGAVDGAHPLRSWLIANDVSPRELDWFESNAVELDTIGLNLYPLFSSKFVSPAGKGAPRVTSRYASGEVLEWLCDAYYERYRRPLMITETASEGSVARRYAWLESSVESVRRVRGRGVPVLGYTWWPLFALVAWSYRRGTRPLPYYLKQMGLVELVPEADGTLRRVPTALVDAYRALVSGRSEPVGRLGLAGSALSGRGG